MVVGGKYEFVEWSVSEGNVKRRNFRGKQEKLGQKIEKIRMIHQLAPLWIPLFLQSHIITVPPLLTHTQTISLLYFTTFCTHQSVFWEHLTFSLIFWPENVPSPHFTTPTNFQVDNLPKSRAMWTHLSLIAVFYHCLDNLPLDLATTFSTPRHPLLYSHLFKIYP